MKSKLLQLRKVLLVAAGLLVGASVWAEDVVETYDFEAWGKSHMDRNSYATMGTASAEFQVNGVNMNQLVITSPKDNVAWDLSTRFAVSDNVSFRWGSGSNDVPRLGNENQSGVRYISVIGLKAGDRVQITCSNTLFYSTNATDEEEETIAKEDAVASGTIYTITGDGPQHLDLYMDSRSWANITKVVVTRSVECAEPQQTITGAIGTARKFTLACETEGATIYYSETEKAAGEQGWDTYEGEVTTSAETIWAYASKDGGDSEVISFATGAGTTLALMQPTLTLTNMSKGTDESYYPVYEVVSDNSSIVGQPAATFKYTFVPTTGSSTSGTLTDGVFAFPSQGTLIVTAEATGYDDSQSAEITVTSKYDLTKTYDFANPISTNLIDVAIWSVTAENVKWLNQGDKTGKGYSIAADAEINGTEMIEGLTMDGGSQGLAGLQIVEGYGLHLNATRGTAVVTPAIGDNDLAIFTGTRSYVADITSAGASYSFTRYTDGNGLQKIDIYRVKVDAVPVTVTEAGFATYVNIDYDLDFSATDIEAYKVKVSTKGVATLTKVDKVPAGTPVLLYAEGGVTDAIPVTTGAAAIEDNDLIAGTGATVATIDGDYTNMILNVVDEKIGFYFANNQTVAANRAYLHIATELAPEAASDVRLSIVFGGETTGIDEAIVNGTQQTVGTYNLNGQRVAQPTKGLYIVNGKKVIIK